MSTRASAFGGNGACRIRLGGACLRAWLIATLALLAACEGDDNNSGFIETGQVRIVHAVSDGPRLGLVVGTGVLGSLGFAESTGFISVGVGRQLIDVQQTPPGGSAVTLINDQPVNVATNTQTTMVIHGSLASPRATLVDARTSDIATGKAEVHFFNATDGDRYDFYFTAPGADIAPLMPNASLPVGSGNEVATVDAGNFRLRITSVGTKTVLYDSGTTTLLAQRRRLFVAIDHFGRSGEPVRVLAIEPALAAVPSQETLGSRLRVANLIADVAAVDVYLGAPVGTPAFDAVMGDRFSAAVNVAAGEVAFTATVDNDPSTVLASGSVQVVAGDSATLALSGTQAGGLVRRQLLPDLVRPIATLAQVQLLHGARGSPRVNVYVLAPGGQIVAATSPTVPLLNYLTRVELELGAGMYDVIVADTASPPVEVERLGMTVAAGTITQLTLSDAPGGGTPPQLQIVEQITP